MKIQQIKARQILDSRGFPTIEVDVIIENGIFGRAAVPSGASKGSFEALEIRDGTDAFHGKGVTQAIKHIMQIIAPQIKGMDISHQSQIDQTLLKLDATENKSKLGANAILGVSMACLKAAAYSSSTYGSSTVHNTTSGQLFKYLGGEKKYSLPVPLINILNGGVHAHNALEVQEFMIVPLVENSFSLSLRAASEIFHCLKSILKNKGFSTAVGDEGGFAPSLQNNQQALDLICLAIEKTKYRLGEDIFLALDVAATEFSISKKNEYFYLWEGQEITGSELISIYETWQRKFPLISIEDALAENDWEAWREMTSKLKGKLQMVGDDLFVTHPQRLKMGIEKSVADAILIKPNQIGTITETKETISLAKAHGYNTIMSHRSGETEDTIIADLAVGFSCSQIKTGSVCRSERLAKYNQLIRIEEDLKEQGQYAGYSFKPMK